MCDELRKESFVTFSRRIIKIAAKEMQSARVSIGACVPGAIQNWRALHRAWTPVADATVSTSTAATIN